jgi:hypothetical protein
MSVAPPLAVTAVHDPMSFTAYWDCLNSHAECCESMAKTMLVAEGATPDEVEAIFRNPDEWVARHGYRFDELIAARDATGTNYDPLKDKDVQGSMKALNNRAVIQTISAVSQLFHFRIAQAKIDVFAASASVLKAWNLLFVAGTELATGERAFAVVQAPRLLSAKSRGPRWETDPKTQQKEKVRECWCAWQVTPKSYRTKAAFARDMLEKYEHLTSQKKIEDWCREWEKAKKNLEPSR